MGAVGELSLGQLVLGHLHRGEQHGDPRAGHAVGEPLYEGGFPARRPVRNEGVRPRCERTNEVVEVPPTRADAALDAFEEPTDQVIDSFADVAEPFIWAVSCQGFGHQAIDVLCDVDEAPGTAGDLDGIHQGAEQVTAAGDVNDDPRVLANPRDRWSIDDCGEKVRGGQTGKAEAGELSCDSHRVHRLPGGDERAGRLERVSERR